MKRRLLIAAAVLTVIFIAYITALSVCREKLINNVFDEIYYSEMQSFLFRLTKTNLRNLSGFITFRGSVEDYMEKEVAYDSFYSTIEVEAGHYVLVSRIHDNRRIVLNIDEVYSDYIIHFCYEYDVECNALNINFRINHVSQMGYEKNEVDNLEEFFKEKGLSYEYLRKQQKVKLDEFLGYWFDMNNGLSRFSLDDLGDFTIEYEY